METDSGFRLDLLVGEDDVNVLRAEIAAATDTRQAALLLYELGRIALAEGNAAGAADHLARCYAQRPQFRPALRLTQQLYRQRDNHKLVVKTLEAEARATREVDIRASLLRRQARLIWIHLGDLEGARKVLNRSLEAHGEGWAALLLFDLLEGVRGDLAGRRVILARQLEAATDPKLRAALQVDLALLATESEPEQAVELLQSAAEGDPDNRVVLSYLEHVCLVTGQDRALAHGILRAAELAEQPPERARLLARAAAVHRDRLDDRRAAADLLFQSLQLCPGFANAADCIDLLLAQDRLAEAATVAEQVLQLEEHPEAQATMAFRLAERHRRAGQDLLAVEWYRRCLDLVPGSQPVQEALVSALEQMGDQEQVLAAYSSWLSHCDDQDSRCQTLFRMGALQERLGRIEEAARAHRLALEQSQGFLPSFAALKRIYSRSERWDDLLRLLEDELAGTNDPQSRVPVLELTGAVHAQRPPGQTVALECYRKVLEVAPRRLSTLRTAIRLCEATQRWEELVQLSEQELTLVNDPQRMLEILQLIGEVCEQRIGDSERAIVAHERALAIDAEFLPSLQALGRLYGKSGRWSDLIRMHEAEIAVCSDPEQIVYLLDSIAETSLEGLGDEERAADAYRAMLEHKPYHAPAVAALLRIFAGRSAWEDVVELLESCANGLVDDQRRALLLLRIGQLRDLHLGQPDRAVQEYARAVRLARSSPAAWTALVRLHEASSPSAHLSHLFGCLAGRIQRLERATGSASLIRQLAELIDHHDVTQAALLAEIARRVTPPPWLLWLLAREYQRLGAARELCGSLEQLANQTVDEQVAAEAWLKLARLQLGTQTGDQFEALHHCLSLELRGVRAPHTLRAWERLVRDAASQDRSQGRLAALLQQLIPHTSDPRELAILYTELGEVYERRQELALAEPAYRQALQHSAVHHRAFWCLGRLLEAQARWGELAELVEQQLSVIRSKEELIIGAMHAAVLWQDRAKDPQRAIPLLEQVVGLEPAHRGATRRLRDLLRSQGQWAKLAALMEQEVATGVDSSTLIDLLVELSSIYARRLGRPADGQLHLRRVLELDAENGPALRLLADLHFNESRWAEAQALYERAEWCLFGAQDLAYIRRRLGETFLAQGQPQRALIALRQAHHQDATQDPFVLRAMAKAAERSNDVACQVEALEDLAGCSQDEEEQIRALRQAATLADTHLDDERQAERLLQRVLALDPLQVEAIEYLAGIYGRSSDRSALARHMEAAVAQHRAALFRRPLESKLYWQLSRLFRWLRLFDAQYCSYVALSRLGPLGNIEQEFLQRHHAHSERLPTGQLTSAQYERLVLAPAGDSPLRDLLRAAGDRLARTVAAKPSQFGLSRGDRAPKAVRDLCVELAGLIGFPDMELEVWVSAGRPELVTAELFSGPALIMGEQFADNTGDPRARFHLGRALCLLHERRQVVERWGGGNGRALAAALGKVVEPAIDLPVAPGDRKLVSRQAQSLKRTLGRTDRRRLFDLLSPLLEREGELDVDGFTAALDHTACRAGLVLACDPLVALRETEEISGGPQSSSMVDLLQYVVSTEYLTVRKKLGVAPVTD